MATRTAPTVDGSETYKQVSMSLVDADDGELTVTFRVDAAATDVQIETLATELQDISNASLWRVEVGEVYEGTKDKTNADADDIVSVFDAIRLTSKLTSSGAYVRAYAPAPKGAIIQSNGVVDTANGLYIAWRDAVDAVTPTGFVMLNTSFVQNSRRNQSLSPTA